MLIQWLQHVVIQLLYNRVMYSDQEENSISLNQNTVIQEYHGLDSSDQQYADSSSNQQPLSESHLKQLNQMTQIQQVKHQNHQHRPRNSSHNRPSVSRHAQRISRDLEYKYDIGHSPSTKEEQSLMRQQQVSQRRSNPIHLYTGSNLPNIESDSHEQNSFSDSAGNSQPQRQSQISIQSGRQAKLGNRPVSSSFNIDNFLNANPLQPKSSKGISILGNKQVGGVSQKREPHHKYRPSSSQIIQEEDTINLITLPEYQIEKALKIQKAVEEGQKQLQQLRGGYQRRFNNARLTFMDTFAPEPLKIKNNPYNLFKYINNRIRI